MSHVSAFVRLRPRHCENCAIRHARFSGEASCWKTKKKPGIARLFLYDFQRLSALRMEVLFLNKGDEVFFVQRLAIEEPLYKIALVVLEEVGLLALLNALCDRFLAKFVCHFDDGSADIVGRITS